MQAVEGSQDAEEVVEQSSVEVETVVGPVVPLETGVGERRTAGKSYLVWWKLLALRTKAGIAEMPVGIGVGWELGVGAVLVAEEHTLVAGHIVVVGVL
jgi:hypothetical protein